MATTTARPSASLPPCAVGLLTGQTLRVRLGNFCTCDGAGRVVLTGQFHFCRYYKGEAFYQAIARHEHFLAAQTGIKPGMRVLDVGGGVGGHTYPPGFKTFLISL